MTNTFTTTIGTILKIAEASLFQLLERLAILIAMMKLSFCGRTKNRKSMAIGTQTNITRDVV